MNADDKILTGKDFFKELLPYLTNAKREILLTTFKIARSTRGGARDLNLCINALSHAARRGVQVKCLIHCPARPSMLAAQNLKVIKSLESAGVEIRSRGKYTCLHAKIVIIDREALFIGSHNFCPGSCLSNFEISLLISSEPALNKAILAFCQAFEGLATPRG